MEKEGRENPGFISTQNGKIIQRDETGVKVLSKGLEQLRTDIKEFSKTHETKIEMLCEKLDKFELMMTKIHEDHKGG